MKGRYHFALAILVVSIATVVAVIMGIPILRDAGRANLREAAVRADAVHEARILAWVVERNPQATIKDFSDFPRVLLDESRKAGIDFRIILAIADKESGFRADAIGAAGEVGLMQVLPGTGAATAKAIGMEFELPVRHKGKPGYVSLGTLGDPKLNVRIGIAYLREQVARFGATPTAIRAYNRHPDSARKNWPWDRYAEDVGLRLVTLVHEFPR